MAHIPIDIIGMVNGSMNRIASTLLDGKPSPLLNLEKTPNWRMIKDKNLQSILELNAITWDEHGFAYRSTEDMMNLFVFFWEKYKGGVYKIRVVRRGRAETKFLPIDSILKEFSFL